MPRKSVETQLLSCLNIWTESFEMGYRTDIFYLDLSKAFDTIDYNYLLDALRCLNFDQTVINFFASYLYGRSISVSIGNNSSSLYSINRGVPQGSVLGPLLFTIFLSDIPNQVSFAKIKLYADNIKLMAPITCQEDMLKFQKDIDSVCDWLCSHGLTISVPKCGILSVGTKSSISLVDPPNYTMLGEPVQLYDNFRDLGIIIESDLGVKRQIDKITTKASRQLNVTNRLFRIRNTNFRLQMYKTYVRPILESGSILWNPSQVGSIKLIESVQKRFLKYLQHSSVKKTAYLELCEQFNIEPLIVRRTKTDLTTLYKLFHDHFMHVNSSDFVTLSESNTRGHEFKIHRPFLKSTQRSRLIFYRTYELWNSLPPEVVASPSINDFKSYINSPRYTKQLIDNTFNKFPNVFL